MNTLKNELGGYSFYDSEIRVRIEVLKSGPLAKVFDGIQDWIPCYRWSFGNASYSSMNDRYKNHIKVRI